MRRASSRPATFNPDAGPDATESREDEYRRVLHVPADLEVRSIPEFNLPSGDGSYPPHDQGLYEVTLNPADRGRFRPPSLRNVALTAPYMHDGSISTLADVVRHYAAGGRLIQSGPFAGDGRLSPLKSGLVSGFKLGEQDLADVVAFLESLTDTTFVQNGALSNPFSP